MATDGSSDPTFPAADVDAELNPGTNRNFQEDTGASLVTTSKEIKEQVEAEDKKKKEEEEKKDAVQTIKKSIIVSAVVVAVVGAVFALTKKLREK